MTAIIDQLVAKFEAGVAKLEKKTTVTISNVFRTVVKDHLDTAKPVSKSTTKKESSEKKLDTWPRIWVSKDYGGKKRFPEDYERIKDEAEKSGGKLTSFQILSNLRSLLESEEGRERWQEWYEWVQQEHADAPSDPPSDRQPKKEGKKKPVKKVVTKEVKLDMEVESDIAKRAPVNPLAKKTSAKKSPVKKSSPAKKSPAKSADKSEKKEKSPAKSADKSDDQSESEPDLND